MEETKLIPKLFMMIGIVASGKSTHAKTLAEKENAVIHSSDKLREELFGDVNQVENNGKLFQELHRRIKSDLSNGKNVILDATNISWKKRKSFLDELKKIECEKIAVLMATPYDKCLERNNSRDRVVPEYVIKRMYTNFYIPQKHEGFDEIEIVWDTGNYVFDIHELFNGKNGLNFINQETPYHTLTIGEHCLKCCGECEKLTDDYELCVAALYHDIGKKFVKEYNVEKGHYTYYQHHLVSAYDAMFYLKDEDKDTLLLILNYIQWHMQPFFIKMDKTRDKFINLVGQEFYDKLMILHESDKLAK